MASTVVWIWHTTFVGGTPSDRGEVRDWQVRNKQIYVVIWFTVNGERDILGVWAGDGGEGAKFWLALLPGAWPMYATRCESA